uniref:Uncharacterized protein n=1 Tax=Acrobeloides nanus TaxID=290746 RepID=A0A914CZ03_9BILA
MEPAMANFDARLCECTEVAECRTMVMNSGVENCKSQCKDKLEFFGNNTINFLGCFKEFVKDEIDILDKCLHKDEK